MSDYRIEKVRRRVVLSLVGGRELDGDIFLQAYGRFRVGPEQPLDVLNDGDDFLPIVLPSGELHLVQKTQLLTVETDLPGSDDAIESVDSAVAGMKVELALVDGSCCHGSIFPELRADRPRLVDFLNETRMRFLPVFASDRLLCVSRAHIVSARPLS